MARAKSLYFAPRRNWGIREISNQGPLYRIIIAQLITTIIASGSLAIFGWVLAWSSLLGGLVCVIPNLYLAARLSEGAAAPRGGVRQLVFGEFGKWGLTALMFGAIFSFVEPLDVMSFFGTFIALHAFFILIPLYDRYRQ